MLITEFVVTPLNFDHWLLPSPTLSVSLFSLCIKQEDDFSFIRSLLEFNELVQCPGAHSICLISVGYYSYQRFSQYHLRKEQWCFRTIFRQTTVQDLMLNKYLEEMIPDHLKTLFYPLFFFLMILSYSKTLLCQNIAKTCSSSIVQMRIVVPPVQRHRKVLEVQFTFRPVWCWFTLVQGKQQIFVIFLLSIGYGLKCGRGIDLCCDTALAGGVSIDLGPRSRHKTIIMIEQWAQSQECTGFSENEERACVAQSGGVTFLEWGMPDVHHES